ncbi:DUF5076 domain-containing protein [Lysobacter sp. ESA13C]|uniref:DUF5076 domain-containing protein n=1 Tax=Lysobacter sp. ESA13C TaxID=2862676 RepID=UPI001CBEAC1D|nr:DUF5076 domain-containing protein [Lysobacter sp. ESA13C]
MNEQPIPPVALEDSDSVEMLRVWIAKKGLHCSMKVGMYEETMSIPEEKAWGMILADIARHLADALEVGYGRSHDVALLAICKRFNEEMAKPTTKVKGDFLAKH